MWKYYRDGPNDNLTDSETFESKVNVTGIRPAAGNTKYVEVMFPLKYLSNFWRTFEIPSMSCEVNLILHGHQLVLLLILQLQEYFQ